jgi:NAD(P)-dependent dehydrogenase (short-subunit alcohol dehydrogenase family)
MRLAGKRAVVTGGANGIGLAMTSVYAREGARVIITDIDLAAGKSAVKAISAQGGQAEFVAADMTDEQAVAGLVARSVELLGGIDVWVSNAGTSLTEDLLQIEAAAWEADLRLNLTSHYLGARAVIPVIIEGGGGSLITISSVNALWSIGEFGYSDAKAGLIQFTRNIVVTYGPQGIGPT